MDIGIIGSGIVGQTLGAARGTEMYLALWVRLYGKMKTPAFNVRIVT